jgi:hypothetical protein
MNKPTMTESLDRAVIGAISLAEQTYEHLDKFGDNPPEHLGKAPEQPDQYDGDTLKKVARVHILGSDCHVDVRAEEGGWVVRILDMEGDVLYGSDPGGFTLNEAVAAIPEVPTQLEKDQEEKSKKGKEK